MKTWLAQIIVVLFGFSTLISCAQTAEVTETASTGNTLKYTVSLEGSRTEISGDAFEIPNNNCGAERDSSKTEARSKKFTTSLDMQISAKVAAEFGGDIEVARATLRTEIGVVLGVTIGTETEQTSTAQNTTPINKRTITTFQWKEIWKEGTIAIQRPDDSYVAVLPFAVLNSLTLEQTGVKTLDCTTGIVESQESTPIILPTAIPAIPATPTPVSLGRISVPGNSSDGIRFIANQTGNYLFKYVGGAYSTYPLDLIPSGQATWSTAVRIFKNRPVEWNGIAISNTPDINAVDAAYSSSSEEAEGKVRGRIVRIFLQQGDYLILAAVDGQPYYSDNPGDVNFEVLYAPNK